MGRDALAPGPVKSKRDPPRASLPLNNKQPGISCFPHRRKHHALAAINSPAQEHPEKNPVCNTAFTERHALFHTIAMQYAFLKNTSNHINCNNKKGNSLRPAALKRVLIS
ncbi:hypothetical protein KL86DPRO_30098 [uncultured delta proteobacterium]|uniref:Uncharacterized protein n=1 Tax=uncultured delta proteobacterium TaxID=34034 RepID=A0A212K838_9DELT|nr:hypothetical protein KL86DPRO_30098 [uncultured delta proteobacterium]